MPLSPPHRTPSPLPPKGGERQAPPSLGAEKGGGGGREWGGVGWGRGGVCLYVCVMFRNSNRETMSKYIYIYICIYIEREGETEREGERQR